MPSSTQTEPSEREEDSSETRDVESESTADQHEQPASSLKSTSIEQENSERGSSSNDGEGLSGDRQVVTSSNSPDLSAEGSTENSDSTNTEIEPGE